MKKMKLIGIALAIALVLSAGVVAYTATSGFTVTYLPGTSDTVTDMPAADSGTDGQTYTVSDMIPRREGYVFLGWTLDYGAADPIVDYSEAVTVVNKVVEAAAAGDENVSRKYTVSIEAPVSIRADLSADKAAELYVEDLTITDTIQDEFILNEGTIRAEIVDCEGNVVSGSSITAIITPKDGGATQVSYNFGEVLNEHTARLLFEITAQPDFIGSNGVYTNVGVPEVAYSHDTDNYTVAGTSTPEVNVPVDFKVGEGAEIEIAVGEEIDLAALGSEQIVEAVHEIVRLYDQINGTLSYKWELPDATMVDVPATVHITCGILDAALPDEAAFTMCFTPEYACAYFAKLHVTFTPDALVDSGNFAGPVTAVPVYGMTGAGNVKVIAIS